MESTASSNSTSHPESPFPIPHDDIAALCASEGFQVLRRYLASNADNTYVAELPSYCFLFSTHCLTFRDISSFCPEHDNCNAKAQETWLIHRDILHALIMPVVQLFKRATTLAEAALCTQRPEDLELAFGGDARSAFLWLQCFLADEDDWCRTRGCPGMHVHMETSSLRNLTYTYSLHHYNNLEHGIPYPTHHRRLTPLHFPLLFARLFARALCVRPLPPPTPAHPPRTSRSAFLGSILGPRLLAVPPLARKPPLRRRASPDQRMRQSRSPRRLPLARRLAATQAQLAPPRHHGRRARLRRRRAGHQAAQVPPREAPAEDEG